MNNQRQRRILFVDDEPPVLNLLQTLFRHAHPDWDSAYTDRGAKALQLLAEKPFDVLVSDMRMPEMTGADLLEQVRDRHPRIARVVLSGYADQPLSVRALSAAHQYLAKPFTLTTLQSALGRIFGVERHVVDPELQAALGRLHYLPSPASVHARITRELGAPGTTSDVLGGVIAQDVGLSCKTLQVTTSAFFSAARPMLLAKEAAQSLGLPLIRTLALSDCLCKPAPTPEVGGLLLEALNRHSVTTGLAATRILVADRATPDVVKAAFTAGMLHDAGKLALASALPDRYAAALAQAQSSQRPLVEVERELVGVAHPEAGAYVLGLWGLPDTILDSVAFHHDPRRMLARGVCPLTAVHVANCLDRLTSPVTDPAAVPGLDLEYLRAVGVSGARLSLWLQAAAAG